MASVPTGTFLTAQYVKKRTRLNTVTEAPTFNIEDSSPTPQLNAPPNRARFFSWAPQNSPSTSLLNVPGSESNPSTPASFISSTGSTPSPAPSPIFKFFFSNHLNVPPNATAAPISPAFAGTPSTGGTSEQKPLSEIVENNKRG